MKIQFDLGLKDLRELDLPLVENAEWDKLMKLDLKRKSMWVDQVEGARKRIKRAESTDMAKMRTFLRNWQLRCN